MSINMEVYSQVRTLRPAYWREFFNHASKFFLYEPWRLLEGRDVIQIQAYGESRVIQIRGYYGLDIGVALWKNFRQYWDQYNPDVVDMYSVMRKYQPINCMLLKFSEMTNENEYFIRRHRLAKGPQNQYPIFNSFNHRRVELIEYKFFELLFMLVPKLCEKLVPKNPYQYEDLEMTETVHTALGREIEVTLTYPAGRVPCSKENYFSLQDTVLEYVSVPAGIRTLGELVCFFRMSCGRTALPSKEYLQELDTKRLMKVLQGCFVSLYGCLEKSDLLEAAEKQRYHGELSVAECAKLFGLAHALWKHRTVQTTKEAIAIIQIIGPCHKYDPLDMRFFLQELYLELGLYSDVIALMECFPGEFCAQWFWTAPLLHFKKKGAESNSAKRALKEAVRQNPNIVKYLGGRTPLPNHVPKQYSIRGTKNAIYGDENEALRYVHGYRRFWMQTPGAMAWVDDLGHKYLADIHREQFNKAVYSSRTGPDADLEKGIPSMACLKIPLVLLNCNLCKKEGVKIQKCANCRRVGYCSRECQKTDWRRHKKECMKLKRQGEAAQRESRKARTEDDIKKMATLQNSQNRKKFQPALSTMNGKGDSKKDENHNEVNPKQSGVKTHGLMKETQKKEADKEKIKKEKAVKNANELSEELESLEMEDEDKIQYKCAKCSTRINEIEVRQDDSAAAAAAAAATEAALRKVFIVMAVLDVSRILRSGHAGERWLLFMKIGDYHRQWNEELKMKEEGWEWEEEEEEETAAEERNKPRRKGKRCAMKRSRRRRRRQMKKVRKMYEEKKPGRSLMQETGLTQLFSQTRV